MQAIVHHLICGWQGFVRALLKATSDGFKFAPEDLDTLEGMRAEVEELIARQHRMP